MNFAKDQKVFCTTTKIVKRKPIVQWIKPILNILQENPTIVYCLAGFMNNAHSNEVLNTIKSIYKGDNLRLMPLLIYEELNDLYNASDYSIWFDASITIQESMGAGLKMIIPNSKRVNHLVDDVNGFLYNDLTEIPKLITHLPQIYNRNQIAEFNSKFSYKSIIENILDRLDL